MRGRLGRGPAVAIVVLLGLALFATSLPSWATASVPTTTGSTGVSVTGADAAPGVSSAGLVVLVAGVVLALAGRLARVLAVIGIIAGGGLAAVSAARFLADPEVALGHAAAAVSGVPVVAGDVSTSVWPVLAIVVASVAVLAGATLPVLASSWQRVGRRYEIGGTGSRSRTPRGQAMDDWDALSRGDDPSQPDDTSSQR